MGFTFSPQQNSTLLTKSKMEVFNIFMINGWTQVIVDPSHLDVELPLKLKNDPIVTLLFGYDLPKPIPDLTVNTVGISATLSFNLELFKVCVPWDAIRGITDQDGTGVYYTAKQGIPIAESKEELTPVVPTGRPALTVLKGGKN